MICNRAKPDRRGGASLHPLGIPEYHWGIFGIDYVTDLPKSGLHCHTVVLMMVCHLAKIAHFGSCHKEINTNESANLFVSNYYKLQDVPKVIVPDRDPKFVGK